ncbi:MAG: cytochrome b/b6 domain-containing protein [Anaeromyxobacteraceae bacterium]
MGLPRWAARPLRGLPPRAPRRRRVRPRHRAARRPACAGHNPLAGWMVLALLAVLLVQGATGLFANDDIAFEGPLAAVVSKAVSDLLTSMHRTDAILLLALVAMHLGAVLFHVVVERRNPVPAMFTGRKRWTGGLDAPEPGPSSPWLAAALFVAACAAITLVVNAPGLGRTGGTP